MGYKKSIRYEVLVYSKTNTSSTNEQQHQQTTSPLTAYDDLSSMDSNSATTALFETRIQRFTCDRENMQQYWIPEGYHPVLVPRAYLTANSLVATSNIPRQLMNTARNNLSAGNAHQLQPRINDNLNDFESRRRRILNNNSSSCTNNGGVVKKKRRNNNINVNTLNANRRTILGQSSPTAVNINATIHRQRIKERISALRNAAVSISPNSSLKNNHGLSDRNYKTPSIMINEMWKNESESIKKHYERSALRKKLAQALAFEKKFSSSCGKPNSKPNTSSHVLSQRQHVNQTACSSNRLAVLSNAVEGINVVNCSGSFDNTAVQIIRQNAPNDSHRSFDKVNSAPSSPTSPMDQRDPLINNNRSILDLMTRSDEEEGYSSEIDLDTDNNSTITTIAY